MTAPIDVTDAPVRQPGQTGVFYRPGLTNPNPTGNVNPGPSGPVVIAVSGPFFTTAPALVARMLDEMKFHVAAQALADVQYNLDRSIRHPTPYYETQIMVQQRRVDDWVVHDRGIAYGPWLEGLSSRNRTTRFKGYFSFRRAVQSAGQKAPQVVAPIARRFVDAMNQ